MSTREKAVELLSSLSEDQVKALIDFVKGFSAAADGKSDKDVGSAKTKTVEEKRRAFESLTQRIEESAHLYPYPEDNDKEVLAEHRREKYGL